MTRAELEQRLLEIVRREKPDGGVPLEAGTLLADAGIDSLDALTILFAVEEEFKIHVSDTQARSMKTVGDLVDIVASQLSIES